MIDQYQAFTARWAGLKEKMTEVAATAPAPVEPAGKGTARSRTGRGAPRATQSAADNAAQQAGHVDSVLAEWHAKLNSGFWAALQKEFTLSGVTAPPFHDAPSFSSSVRSTVASLTASKQDPKPFVEDLWKQKVDKDWRDALTKESMLGKTEYAALDRLVSELSRDTIDMTFVAIVGGIFIAALALWFFVFRKKKGAVTPAG
jgi:cobalamin biosynthesis Mg chelatase CobN